MIFRLFSSLTNHGNGCWALLLLLLFPSCESPLPPVPRQGLVRLEAGEAKSVADSIRQATPVQLAAGLELSLWASDSLLADPVALSMDPFGRAYVTRTHRQKNSEFDIRAHREWMTPSISLATVEDRRKFLHETFAPEKSDENTWLPDLNGDSLHDWRDLTVEKEQILRIEDTDNDGTADQSYVFAEGFHTEVTDVAGGLLVDGDDYFLGVAPDLWRLRDNNGDGTIDEMVSISHGYQVHIGFGGHGMSGLIVGPDDKIYWSIGDIGSDITDQTGKRWANPNQGAIFRANRDGSDFEVYAAGLRNTHEFAFDAYGNLITVDNDGDYPDEMERLMYVVHGSDAGWRANWQYGKYTDPDNNRYNVWMDEGMFKPRFAGQAAYIVPPIQNYHSGPTGLKYQPGTALGGRWQNHFFVVEFTGAPSRAKLHAFELEPEGAGFALKQEEVLVQGVLATGLDIGADGALYFSDWITGWGTKNYGRIWKLDDPESNGSTLRNEVKNILQQDFSKVEASLLVEHLSHADMRVRQNAQFELAKRGKKSVPLFLESIRQQTHQLARIHGIWGIAQLVRQKNASADQLVEFLLDKDPEIRAQVLKMLGDLRYEAAGEAYVAGLTDPAARVRFFAAEAIGRTAYQPAVAALIQMLEKNDDQDVYLRHAGCFALAQLGQSAPLVQLASHPSKALRIAAVVALRRMKDAGLIAFLQDNDLEVVTEAARAIHDDYSVPAALPALADLLQTPQRALVHEPLARRVMSAASRVGRAEDLTRLASLSADPAFASIIRAESISALAVWSSPSVLDRVDGRLRGPVKRDSIAVHQAILPHIDQLLAASDPEVLAASIHLIGRQAIPGQEAKLETMLRKHSAPAVRVAAMKALFELASPLLPTAIRTALLDRDRTVRESALSLTPQLPASPTEIVSLLETVIERADMEDKQAAVAALAQLPADATQPLLETLIDRWKKGRLPTALQVELQEVVEKGQNFSLNDQIAAIRAAAESANDPLALYADVLMGGSAEAGLRVAYYHEAGQCVRCHAMQAGSVSGGVGPNLAGVGNRLSRESILLSLVAPSAELALGYGTATLTLQDGSQVRGILLSETSRDMTLQTEQAEPIKFPKQDIARVQMAPSAMPPMGLILSRRELRDVVAFLTEMK